MADIHNALRRGQLSVALSASVGDSRQGGLERYGETLTPVIDLWGSPEFAYLRGDNFGAIFGSSGAVAAEFSFDALATTLTSGLLLVVEAISVRGSTPIIVNHISRASLIATGAVVGAPQNRDERYRSDAAFFQQSMPVDHIQGTDPAGFAAAAHEEIVATAAAYFNAISCPHIIKPGGGLVVQGTTVNTSIQVNWRFRVRQIPKTEQSLASL